MRTAPALALILVCLFGGSACSRLRVRAWNEEERCGPPRGPETPRASLAHDPAPFEIRRAAEDGPAGKPQPGYVYRFEREKSGTTENLRAVHMMRQGPVLVVGDHGMALVRDSKTGWWPEATGTTENLYALVASPHYPDGSSISEEQRKKVPYVAVGSHGAAVPPPSA